MAKPPKHAVYEYAMPLGLTIWIDGDMGAPPRQADARAELRARAAMVHAKINDRSDRRWIITVPAHAEPIWVLGTNGIPKAHCRRLSGP